MKKRKIMLFLMSVGLFTLSKPIVAHADSEYKGNLIYTYNENDELVSVKFREGQLVADPGASATQKYTPKYYYGDTNLVRKISSDLYGQKYVYMLPEGYNMSSLKENTALAYTDSCYINSSKYANNNFKAYSEKYKSSGTCSNSNFDNGGSFSYNGKKGEWRVLGYNSYGDSSVDNPVFPSDHQSGYSASTYPWISGVGNKTIFDNRVFEKDKLEAIEGAMELYGLSGKPEDWLDKLSLQTDPTSDTPIFRGQREGNFYNTLHAPTKSSLTRDLSITKFEILYKGEVIGIFTRDDNGNVKYDVKENVASGNTYTYKITVKNTSDADMDSNNLKVNIGYALGENALLSDELDWFSKDSYKSSISGKSLKKGESITLSGDMKIKNLSNNSSYRATSVIDKNHYLRKNPDSTDKSNDWGKLLFNVDNGNIKATKTALIDESGNVVNHAPIPGEKYKVRFYYKYEGLDRNSDFDLEFKNVVVKTLNTGNTDTFKDTVSVKMSDLVSKKSNGNIVETGDEFSIETDYMVFETPVLQASSSLTQNSLVDSNPNDNSTSNKYYDEYDIKITNVRIYPLTEMPTTLPSKIKVGIKYDIDVEVPSYVEDYEVDVKSQINENTIFVDHVKKGKNKDITREIEVTVNGAGTLPAIINVNKPSNIKERIWESDYTNNKGDTRDYIGEDGNDGSLKIKAPDNPNKGGCSLGINNEVSFDKVHNFIDYNGDYVESDIYKNSDIAKSHSGLYSYSNSNIYEERRNYNESYEVKQVLFKSKLTTDLNLGDDGWVDLNSDDAKIKAGYGYEIKVIVNYNTNAISSQPSIITNPSNPLANHGKSSDDITSKTSNGVFVTDLNVLPNIYKDIYLRTEDNKVFSASGIYDSVKAFTSRELSNDENGITVEYSLVDNGRIYIDENTKNGDYKISIFTPNISGASGETLCDKKEYNIKVEGSFLDDNKEHLVQ